MSAPKRLSGLQREVLALYRKALRMTRAKPPATRPKFELFVRHAFRTSAASVSPRELTTIEYLIRRGGRQLEMFESPDVRDVTLSAEMQAWAREHATRRQPLAASEHA
ncbi:hypothetical protein PENSPDRAFT_685721 [Peniophora sp. CONT]|nr:hypothetical protein PENSPDRAFT_685721 [Peniophora sp. CONT]